MENKRTKELNITKHINEACTSSLVISQFTKNSALMTGIIAKQSREWGVGRGGRRRRRRGRTTGRKNN